MSSTSPSPAPCGCTKPADCVDRHPGRYLAAVHRLERGRETRLPTGALGTHLGVSPASATEMVKQLDAAGLVDYEKYRGVEVTARGSAVARELALRRCIVRTFFAAKLDVDLDVETGYRIGYSLPRAGIRGLYDRLDRPPSDCRSSTD